MLLPLSTINNPVYPNRLVHGERRIIKIEQTVAMGASATINTPLGSYQWFIDSVYRFSLQLKSNLNAGGVFRIELDTEGGLMEHYVSFPILHDTYTVVQDLPLPGFWATFYIVNSNAAGAQTFDGRITLRGVI